MKKMVWAMLICSSLLLSGCGGSAEPYVEEEDSAAPEMMAETAAVTTAGGFTSDKSYFTAGGEQRADEGMNYFTFRSSTTVHEDGAGRELMTESLTDPDFFSTDPEQAAWVNALLDGICESDAAFGRNLLSFAKKDLNETGEEGFYPYSNHVTMGIARHDGGVASLLTLSSAYSGGAHPNSVQTAYNLDLAGMRVLRLEDVIRQEAAPELTQLVLEEVERRFAAIGDNTLFDDYAQTVSNALSYGAMTSYWYFTEEGLAVFFNQYELAPFASGIVKAEIPYDRLDGILLDAYFPPAHTGTVQDAWVSETPDDDDWIYYVDLSEGKTAYVSVDSKVDHVQFSEVFWAGRTVVGESMLFSANRITGDATLAVTGDFSDPQKIYALEFYDANGGPYVLYVHREKASWELPILE